jgi:hypothetical protein
MSSVTAGEWADVAPELRATAGHIVGEIARLVPD